MKKPVPKRAILFGPMPIPRALVRELKITSRDYVIAVDGGLDQCLKLGLKPRLAVGDWDSCVVRDLPRVLARVPHLTLDREKDWSDLCFALDAAAVVGAREVVCLGVTGGRPDHHLAVLLELTAAAAASDHRFRALSARGPEGRYHFLSERVPLWKGSVQKGAIVSVFALGGPAEGVSLEGFKYPLRNATLDPSSRGLSNVAAGSRLRVRVRGGRVVIVIPS